MTDFSDVLTLLPSALFSYGPTALIGLVGLVLTAVLRVRGRGLVIAAMLLLLLSSLVGGGWFLFGPLLFFADGVSMSQLNLGHAVVGVATAALNITCWTLVLIALFRHPRPVAAPAA